MSKGKGKVEIEKTGPGVEIRTTRRHGVAIVSKHIQGTASWPLMNQTTGMETGPVAWIERIMTTARALLKERGLPTDQVVYYRILPTGKKVLIPTAKRLVDKPGMGTSHLVHWLEDQGFSDLDDEMLAAKVIQYADCMMNHANDTEWRINAAIDVGYYATLWQGLTVSDLRNRKAAKSPRRQLIRGAIQAWAAEHPGMGQAALIEALPACKHDDLPSQPNAGAFVIWREDKNICAMDEAMGVEESCRRSAFYEHVNAD